MIFKNVIYIAHHRGQHLPFARVADLRRFPVLLGWTPDYPLSTFVNLYLGVLPFCRLAMRYRDITITASTGHDYNGDLVGG